MGVCRFVLIVLVGFSLSGVHARDFCNPAVSPDDILLEPFTATISKVVNGDTLYLIPDRVMGSCGPGQLPLRLQIAAIDTPESVKRVAQCGDERWAHELETARRSTAYLRQVLSERTTVTVRTLERGRIQRQIYVGEVSIETGRTLAAIMLENNCAMPLSNDRSEAGKPKLWCETKLENWCPALLN